VRRGASAVLAAALLLSACTGDDDAETAAADTTAPPETTSTTAAPVDPASVPAAPSPGCGGAATTPPGEAEHVISSGGTDRTYAQYVPTAHTGDAPVPLVLDIHGLLEGGPIHALHTGLGPYGEQEGFVTITPDSGRTADAWELQGDEDVTFMGDLLDQVEGELCIDRNRVYSTGLSWGGLMTTVLGCRLSDRIAAAAPVAGIAVLDPCDRTRPVPAIIFHGTDDEFLAYDGGVGAAAEDLPLPDDPGETAGDVEDALLDDVLPGAEASAAAWAEGNGCPDAEPATEPVSDTVDRLDYGCEVELYRVVGGGHTWPGSAFDAAIGDIVGPVDLSVSANEVMWAFFQAHPL
jgi:polyhydroxybutyrate depolymerase